MRIKYRILKTNTDRYKLQYKKYWFIWNTIRCTYDSIEDAGKAASLHFELTLEKKKSDISVKTFEISDCG